MATAEHRRRVNDRIEERREGPSRLSQWGGRQVLLASIAWVVGVVVLVALGTLASVGGNHGLTEARIAFSRSNVIGLIVVLIVPPFCLVVEWWLMRGRRRGQRRRRSEAQ